MDMFCKFGYREDDDNTARTAKFFSASTSLFLVIACSTLCGLFAAYTAPWHSALLCGLTAIVHVASLMHYFVSRSCQVVRVTSAVTLVLLPLLLHVTLGGRQHSQNIAAWAGTGPVFTLLVFPTAANGILLLWAALEATLMAIIATVGPVDLYGTARYLPAAPWGEMLLLFNGAGPLLLCYWYLQRCQKEVRVVTGEMTHAHRMVTSVREASEAKGLFLAKISHELRTPLLGILGITEALLLEGANVGTHWEDLKTIHSSGEYLLTLVNDVLEYERSAQGNLPATMECMSVQEVAQEVLAMQRPAMERKGLAFQLQMASHFPSAFADRIRTKQVLTNLVNNAVKFTDSGGVSVVACRLPPAAGIDLPAQLLTCQTEADIARLLEHHTTGTNAEHSICLPGMMPPGESDISQPARHSPSGMQYLSSALLPNGEHGEPGSKLEFLRRFASSSEAFLRNHASSQSVFPGDSSPTGTVVSSSLNDFIIVMVKDSGPGIQEEDQRKLFQVFSQVDETVTRKYGGSGLGLAICKTLVERMGGRIGVVSAGGQGSVFWFTLPVHTAVHAALNDPGDSVEVQEDLEVEEMEKSVPDRMEVLVVDDTLVNCRVLERFLSFVPFVEHVCVAHNGQEALDALAQNPRIKAVLMDWHMPVMDGLTCTARIRSQFGDAMIVIGVTASVLPGDAQKCLQSGMSDVLRKPFTCHALRRTLLSCVLRQAADIRTPLSSSPQAEAGRQSQGFCRALLRSVVRSSVGGAGTVEQAPHCGEGMDFTSTSTSPHPRPSLLGLRLYELPSSTAAVQSTRSVEALREMSPF